jgi:hypothetical protein
VFVRVLLLTVDMVPTRDRLHAQISDLATQALLIDGVILLIADSLCSDNVCCLNTCILFFYFALRDGTLPTLLSVCACVHVCVCVCVCMCVCMCVFV